MGQTGRGRGGGGGGLQEYIAHHCPCTGLNSQPWSVVGHLFVSLVLRLMTVAAPQLRREEAHFKIRV